MVRAMRAWFVVVIALVGCGNKKDGAASTTGSGSGSAVAAAVGSGSAATGSGSAVAAGSGSGSAAPSGCTLDGSYRMRFASNGTEGWWLRLGVTGGKDVKITGGALAMLGLDEKGPPADIAVDDKACTIVITRKTEQAGDLKISLKVDGTKVAGTVERTDKYGKPNTPLAGVRDTEPQKYPDCIKPGRYEIKLTAKKWKLDGTSHIGSCKDMADVHKPNVRVEMMGDTLLVDEIGTEEPFEQGFSHATITRVGDCEADIVYSEQDVDLKAGHIKFEGDKVTGKATDYAYQVMEDGEAGENMWTCSTTDAEITGKRLGD